MSDFMGRSVLVTGGAGAIGRATAALFLKRGARVTLADRDAAALARALAELEPIGAVSGIEAGLAEEADCERAIAAAEGVDVVFANAGISGGVIPVHEMTSQDWTRILDTNFRGMALTLGAAARDMIAHGTRGAIVTMGSSMAGWDVLAGGAGYLATKHAVVGLTKAAALGLARYGIRVNAVCPGVIETTLGVPSKDVHEGAQRFARAIPLRRIGQPEDVGEVVLFLASDAARHVSGAAWLIDGGQTLQSFANGPRGDAYPFEG